MALTIGDRVQETTTTTGTGTITLAGAKTGYQAASSVLSNADTTYYAIQHQTEDEWEVGLGTYTSSGTTLARTTVISSSNSNNAVDFAAGTKDVFITMPASKMVYLDASGNPVGLAPAHVIQEEGSNLTARTKLNFVGAAVTATDDSGNDATKITIAASNASLPVTRSDGSTSDPIALTSAAIGESLVTDTSPQLGGDLDVNGQSIVSDASNENIPITPHGTGSVVISKLSVTGDTSLDGGSFVFNESGADKDFRIEGDSQANLFVADASADRIGIGVAAPDTLLHLETASAATAALQIESTATNGYPTLKFKNDAITWNVYGANGGSGTYPDCFQIESSGGAVVQVATGGDVIIGDGDLVIGTSGHGISFAATSNGGTTTPSELFDNYEEGTWEPSMRYGSSATAYTHTNQEGRYVKIGRLVWISANMNISNADASNSGSDGLKLYGLPFTITNETAAHSRIILHINKFNPGSTALELFAYAIVNTTILQPFLTWNNGNGWSAPTTDMFYRADGAQNVFVTGCYFANA